MPEFDHRNNDRTRPRMRDRGIYLLPNLFTTVALFAGFYAVVQAMNGRFEHAAVAILIAMVLDGLDGRVGRRLGVLELHRSHVAAAVVREPEMLAGGRRPQHVRESCCPRAQNLRRWAPA